MIREGSIRIPFAFAAGAAASRFLVALRDEGRIVGASCRGCQQVFCPARSFCPRCGAETTDPVDVGPGGVVVSFTQRESGEVFGLVRLDGATTALLHRLLGDPARWTIGARVRARLAPARLGRITDIEGFERSVPVALEANAHAPHPNGGKP